MPTELRVGPYRRFFYAGDPEEPQHVHVERDANVARFWLYPVRLANSGGFRRNELDRVRRLVEEHRSELLKGWNEFFND